MVTEARKEYMRRYQREWMQRRRQAWLAENGPCVRCGSWDRLEVDHAQQLVGMLHAFRVVALQTLDQGGSLTPATCGASGGSRFLRCCARVGLSLRIQGTAPFLGADRKL